MNCDCGQELGFNDLIYSDWNPYPERPVAFLYYCPSCKKQVYKREVSDWKK